MTIHKYLSAQGPALKLLLISFVSLIITSAVTAQQMDTVGPLPADGTWRLAGTFNNWNTKDDDYLLIPRADGTLTLQRIFPAGQYEFKFVRNGDWNDRHAGCAADDIHRLETPGRNIPLIVEHTAPLLIIFDPQNRRWALGKADVQEATPVVVLKTPALADRPVLIDLSHSAARPGHKVTDSRVSAAKHISVKRGENPLRWIVTTPLPGSVDINISVFDGDWSHTETTTLMVDRSYMLMIDYRADAMLPMHLMADGNHAVVTDPLEGERHMFSVLDQSFSKIGMYSMKARDREQFAVVYDPHQGKINVLPGVFATDYDENGIFSFRETGPVPLHDPRRIDYLRAIALDPPLADLHAFTETGSDITSISVLFPDQNGHIATVPLRREIQDKKTRWSARLRFSGPRVKYRLRVEHKNGKTEQHEYTAILNPAVHTPDWAKGATWYQIFPERFDNGDKGNDPRGIGVYLKPWRSDFYAVPADEFKAWQERVRHFGGDPDKWDRAKTGTSPADGPGRNRLYNVIYDRRYGGDLQGVLNRLDYLKGLGVTAIYFNPVFEAESLHKYDTTDYRHIDDNFGPYDPEGDKKLLAKEGLSPDTWVLTSADRFFINKFLPECRKRGIRVIIDGVFNHVGREFFAFRDVREKGSKSRYADWFDVTFDKSGALQSWNAWDGKNGWLPEFRETEDGNLVKPVREYIFNITKRWLDPNGDGDPSDGVDGWRLDVPENIGDPFWIEWHEVVKSINPDAYITAEIWYDASRFLKGDMFDAQMHYPFGSALVDWINVHPGMTSDDLYARWNSAFDNDPPATQLVQQNLCASHDTDRLVSQLFNPGREFDAANRPQDNGPNYKWWRPDDVYFTMSHVALAAQATYVGSPMIFQGAEMGMWGADDPANRKPLTWPEYMPFESPDERYLPGMEQYYHTWLNLRHKWPALRYGNVQHLPTGSARTAAYLRQLNNTVLLVVLNAGDEPYHVSSHLIPPYGKDVRLIPVHVDKNKDGTDERNTLGAYCSGVWQVIYPETVFTPPAKPGDVPRGAVN